MPGWFNRDGRMRFATFTLNERIYTFWKYWRNSFERDAGLRIDHVLLSPDLAGHLRSASVRRNPRSWDHTSDHAPVMIELDLPYATRREAVSPQV